MARKLLTVNEKTLRESMEKKMTLLNIFQKIGEKYKAEITKSIPSGRRSFNLSSW